MRRPFVLSEVGIMIDDPEGVALLLDHGAWERKSRVCLPAGLVERCLKLCPSQVVLRGRSNEITLGNGELHVHNLGGARDVFEPSSNQLRPANMQDVGESARLMDALENVTTVTPLYTPRDVSSENMVLSMFLGTVRNTLKPINGPGVRSLAEMKQLGELLRVAIGDQASVSMGASPVSPLNFNGEIVQVMFEIARQNLPFGPLPCPSVGATAPMSLAGSLVQQNARCWLDRLVQLNGQGCRSFTAVVVGLNMRNGAPIWGNPGGMMSAATVQLGHFYHLPVNVYGLADSGYATDMQSGYERAINALVPALAGADELSGVGEMAGGVCSCNAQIVIDNDIYGMVQRVLKGFAVDEDSLAVEVIGHAMDTSRNFLKEPHTRKYLRAGEIWNGRLGVQEVGWEMWRNAGGPTVVDRAQHEAERILAAHQVPPLSDEQEREIVRIIGVESR
jgi:trimethylamine--corrinoid protein Co-methyltransferase